MYKALDDSNWNEVSLLPLLVARRVSEGKLPFMYQAKRKTSIENRLSINSILNDNTIIQYYNETSECVRVLRNT